MTDLDTVQYLEDFKREYLDKMKAAHMRNISRAAIMTDTEFKQAQELESKLNFLSKFVACIEGTLEQNLVLKAKLKSYLEKV